MNKIGIRWATASGAVRAPSHLSVLRGVQGRFWPEFLKFFVLDKRVLVEEVSSRRIISGFTQEMC